MDLLQAEKYLLSVTLQLCLVFDFAVLLSELMLKVAGVISTLHKQTQVIHTLRIAPQIYNILMVEKTVNRTLPTRLMDLLFVAQLVLVDSL